jgi:hypothetical protein
MPQDGPQGIFLALGEVDLLTLGIDIEQENRHIYATVKPIFPQALFQ